MFDTNLTTKESEEISDREKQFEIPCSGCGHHDSFWKTVVTSPQWYEWDKQVASNFHTWRVEIERIEKETGNKISDDEREKLFEQYPFFDVDECQECGWISQRHFQAFLNFVKNTKDKEFTVKVDIANLADALNGTCDNLEHVFNGIYGQYQLPIDFDELEAKIEENHSIVRCKLCDWWFEVCELNEDNICKDCEN